MTDVERLQRELYALTEVAKTLTLPLELSELLNAVIQKIIGVIEPAEIGTVMLWDQSSGLLRPSAVFGYELNELSELGLRARESVTGKVFDEGIGRLFNTPELVAEAMEDLRLSNRSVMAHALGSEFAALLHAGGAHFSRQAEVRSAGIRNDPRSGNILK